MRQRGPLIFLVVVLAALLPVLFQIAWPFLTSFLLASIMAIVIYPVKEWLSRRIHRPGWATFAITFATVLLLGILLAGAAITLTRELTSAYDSLNQSSLDKGGWPGLITDTTDRVIDAVATHIPVNKDAIRATLIERMKAASGYLLGHVDNALGGVTNIVVAFVMMTVFLYFLLRYGSAWIMRLSAFTPLDAGTAARLVGAVHDSVIANVNGAAAAAVALGLTLILGFWITGLPSPVLWGTLGGLASVIPIVGAPLVWVPVMIAYLVAGSWWKAIFLAVWGGLVVGSADNVVRPMVVGARDKLHPVVIALAAIGGTYAFGALGILLGPLAVSLATAVLTEIQPLVSLDRRQG